MSGCRAVGVNRGGFRQDVKGARGWLRGSARPIDRSGRRWKKTEVSCDLYMSSLARRREVQHLVEVSRRNRGTESGTKSNDQAQLQGHSSRFSVLANTVGRSGGSFGGSGAVSSTSLGGPSTSSGGSSVSFGGAGVHLRSSCTTSP